MFQARTPAEAALYVKLRGYVAIGQSAADGGMVIHGRRATDGAPEEFVFQIGPQPQERGVERMYGGPSASKIIDRQEWLDLAAQGENSVPLDPTGLVADVIRECLQELARAAAALYEVAKFSATDAGKMNSRIAGVGARVNQYAAAIPRALATREVSQLPVPVHRFRADEQTSARVKGLSLPASANKLFGGELGSWRLCAEIPGQKQPMGLFVDDSGALLQASMVDGQLTALALLEGRAGLKAWIKAGFGLGPAEVARVGRSIRLGEPLQTSVASLNKGRDRCEPVVSVYGQVEEIAFFEVSVSGPQLVRGGLLMVIVEPNGLVRGHRVLSGLAGYNQLSVLKEAQGLLPGSLEGADADTVARVTQLSEHIFTKVAEGAYPLLASFIGAPNPVELSNALRPSAADFNAVFGPTIAAAARERYTELWDGGKLVISVPLESENVLIAACTAGGMSFPNAHSRHFHPGMAELCKQLNPRRTWLTWKYLKPGEERGLLHDGLVWIDDHWAWFPHPWEVLADLA